MKKNSKAKVINYDAFNSEKFIYYGVFISKQKTDDRWRKYKTVVKKVDPKRVKKTLHNISDSMYKKMSDRHTKYFFPKYEHANQYVINNIRTLLNSAIYEWKYDYKSMFNGLEKPEKFYNECINDFIATPHMMRFERINHCSRLKYILEQDNRIIMQAIYSQYILYVYSRLTAMIIDLFLDRKMYLSRSFRKDLYSFYEKVTNEKMCETEIFKLHDKFNTIYNYLKHTSSENYFRIKEFYPEFLIDNHNELFMDNGASISLMNMTDNKMDDLFTDLITFFEKYCEVVFKEDIEESKWNHGEFFYDLAWNFIDMLVDPMGINPWGSF